MKKILLTSTGFDNVNIKNKFLKLLDKNSENAKILFIITAAQNPDAVRILSGCLDDLTSCNVKDENITIYDMHTPLTKDEILKYDAIYVCGGSAKYLAERITEIKFKEALEHFINNGRVYVGVSAGSVVASGKYPNILNLISNSLDVHCTNGTNNGIIGNNDKIKLTNNQAICIEDNEQYIFE